VISRYCAVDYASVDDIEDCKTSYFFGTLYSISYLCTSLTNVYCMLSTVRDHFFTEANSV